MGYSTVTGNGTLLCSVHGDPHFSGGWKIVLEVARTKMCLKISTATIEYLKESGFLPVYLYFGFKEVTTQTVDKVAASLLKTSSLVGWDRPQS